MPKSTSHKLLKQFLILSAISAIITVVGIYTIYKKNKINQAEHILHTINESNLQKFNLVADFFSTETRNINFFKTGKSIILLKIDSLNQLINREIETVENIGEINNLQITYNLTDIAKKTNQHIFMFNEVLELVKKRGSGEYGVVGLMRKNLYQLELQNKIDLSYIVKIRKTQRSYWSGRDIKYLDSLKADIERLSESINNNKNLLQNEKDTCALYLQNYATYFESMANLDRQIGLKENGGLYEKINQIENSLQSSYNELLSLEHQKQKELSKNFDSIFLISSILLVLISIALCLYFSKKIAK